MRASGVRPALLRFLGSLISTRAAAPSLMPEALPAVTVPSFEKAGVSFADAPRAWCRARMYSSWSTTMSPLRVVIVTGDDLVLEPAGLLRGLGLVLRGGGELRPARRG